MTTALNLLETPWIRKAYQTDADVRLSVGLSQALSTTSEQAIINLAEVLYHRKITLQTELINRITCGPPPMMILQPVK